MHGLPMESLDEENTFLLGSKLGVVDKVEWVDVNKPFLWVQIHFDIESSFQPGFSMTRDPHPPV